MGYLPLRIAEKEERKKKGARAFSLLSKIRDDKRRR